MKIWITVTSLYETKHVKPAKLVIIFIQNHSRDGLFGVKV